MLDRTQLPFLAYRFPEIPGNQGILSSLTRTRIPRFPGKRLFFYLLISSLCLGGCKVRFNEKDPLFIETQRCTYNQPRVIYTSDTAMTAEGRLQPLISILPSLDADMLAKQFDQAGLRRILAESYEKLPQGRYDIVLELPPSMCLCPPDQSPTNWLGLLQHEVDQILTAQAINPAQTRWIYKTNPVITNPVLYFYVF